MSNTSTMVDQSGGAIKRGLDEHSEDGETANNKKSKADLYKLESSCPKKYLAKVNSFKLL